MRRPLITRCANLTDGSLFRGNPMLSLQEAQRRHARHYADVLLNLDEQYIHGGDYALQVLIHFDQEWAQIRQGHAWSVTHTGDDQAGQLLCGLYPSAGTYLLSLRQSPLERISWLQAALTVARATGDRHQEMNDLSNMGSAYFKVSEYHQAITCLDQALVIARETENNQALASILGNLGNVYYKLGKYDQAIAYQQQALGLAQQIGDLAVEGIHEGNLGAIYADIGEYDRAREYHNKALAISRQTGDRE